MQAVDITNTYLNQAYEQLKSAKPLSPAIVHALNSAKEDYKTTTTKLYRERNFFKKILYFFGIGLSPQEHAQLKCIKKIDEFINLSKSCNLNIFEKFKKTALQDVYKCVIQQSHQADVQSKKFLSLLSYSLRDPASLTPYDFQQIKKVEGTLTLSPEIFFNREIGNFLKTAPLTSAEKECTKKLLDAFRFSKNVSWRAVKYRNITGYANQPWYPANAAAQLHTAIQAMKPGDELCFSGDHQAKGSELGHVVLFSIRMLESGHLCVRNYNTGLAAPDDARSWVKQLKEGVTGWWSSGSQTPRKLFGDSTTTVDQAIFDTKTLLSDEFGTIFTQELLNFSRYNADSDESIFPQYQQFKQTHMIPKELFPNPPQAPTIPTQFFGNCGMASKLVYIKERLGEALYSKFTKFLEHQIQQSTSGH